MSNKKLDDYNNAVLHPMRCMEAIESIGGDPATVADLVEALESQTRLFAYVLIVANHGGACFDVDGCLKDARAVLAKIPENSNEG